MKRGNTALKRGVGLASAFALAIAGAVIAAPAANAAASTDGADAVRATPTANASYVDSTGGLAASTNASNVYGTPSSTGTAKAVQGNASVANGFQIVLAGDDVGSTVKVSLPTGVTFVGTPAVTVDPVAVDYASLKARSAGFSANNADPAHIAGVDLNSTDITVTTASLPSVLEFKLNATTHAGAHYLVTVDPPMLKVDPATAAAGPVTASVLIGTAKVGVTTLGFVPKYTLSTPADATLDYVPTATQDFPAITLAEGVNSAFSAASYTLSITGASFVTGAAADAAVKATGTNGVAGTLSGSVAAGSVTIAVTGAASAAQSLDITGLQVTGVTAGTAVKVSLTAPAAGAELTAINYGDDVTTHTASAFSFVPNSAAPSTTVAAAAPRIAGDSRYATAADIAARYAGGASVNSVILANGLDAKSGIDALSANYLARTVGGPILLTDSSASLPADTRAALVKLLKGATGVTVGTKQIVTIYVMGKTDSVSDAAVNDAKFVAAAAVASTVDSVEVVRLGGSDRYETAAKVAGQTGATIGSYKIKAGAQYLKTAILASGQANADALAAGSLSAAANIPVLLTTSGDTLPKSTADAIKAEGIRQVIILGGTDRVSDKAVASLADLGVTSTQRIAGSDRYATAADLYAFASQAPTGDKVGLGLALQPVAYLANGTGGFADALAVGPLAGKTANSPSAILTTTADALPSSTGAFLKSHSTDADPAGSLAGIASVGGTDRVSAGVVKSAEDALAQK